MSLHIAADLELPDDTITKTLAILAKRRVGKTYTGSVLAEEFVDVGLPFYVLDPTGAWWGLRAAANGRDPGLPVVVLGGDHGDVPIDHTAGASVAELVVEEPGFYVVDLSEIHEVHANTVRFATAFLTRLKALKRRHRDPLHGIWDEADVFAPQRPGPDETKMLGAAEAIVRRGGLHGLGTTLITQRPAVLNKNVLTQLDILVMLRIIGPQDRAAVDDYLKANADPARRREVLDSLGGLDLGEAWLFGPGEEPELYRRCQIRERRTFNSSATPKPGQRRIEPAQLAAIDLGALRDRMAASIERAAADDPRALRARIRQLERDLRERPAAEPERVEVLVEKIPDPVIAAAAAATAEAAAIAQRLDEIAGGFGDLARDLRASSQTLVDAISDQPIPQPARATSRAPLPAALPPARPAPAPAPARRAPLDEDLHSVLTASRQRILDAIASLEQIGAVPAPKIQVALLAGVSHKSSGYQNNLGALRTAGLIDYPAGGTVALTDTGRPLADGGAAPASPEAMWTFVEQLVGGSKWRILRPLIDAYPQPVSKTDLAAAAGVSPSSSGFQNNCGSLRSLQLVSYPAPGMIVANPILFLET